MSLHLYNTLSRKKEPFVSLKEKHVRFYSCGPTVYDSVHIGNLRAFLCADTLYRWLHFGMDYQVQWVMNITDVDDKTIRGSQAKYPKLSPMEALKKFTRHYETLFFRDLEQLNIRKDSFFGLPRATESIPEMQDLIRKVVRNGIGYVQDGSVYFSIAKYLEKEQYGKLLNLDLGKLKTGTRTLTDEIEKENVQDFVLWKAHKEGEPFWDFDLEDMNLPGRPGWHVECSAMEYAAFGLPFDIHSGGVDLKFPHHEDEIAQSTAGYGVNPTKYWIHNEHLIIEGQKMSKSLGNFYTLQNLLDKGYTADVVRFFLVTNHYRTKLNLTEEALKAAHEGLQRIRNSLMLLHKDQLQGSSVEEYAKLKVMGRIVEIKKRKKYFNENMCDDLNTPNAIAQLYEILSDVAKTQKKDFSQNDKEQILQFFELAEKIFGIRLTPQDFDIPVEIVELAEKRQTAKQNQDFKTADDLRQQIMQRGFSVRDTKDRYEILPLEL